MSAPHYQFLPYARTALAASATTVDGARLTARLSVRVGRTMMSGAVVTDSPVEPVQVGVSLYGPADGVGLEPAQILRTQPRSDDWDVEPNYLASVEFDSPELPWLLTPALPAGGRLAPWIVLVVLPDRQGLLGSAVGCGLPVLRTDLAELPNLAESWAWAHVQILSETTDPAALQALIQDPSADPLTLSRLLSPRKLEPNTAYLAVVVPAFAAGVAAAGVDVTAGAADAPAWGPGSHSPVVLPVYHSWRFRTGTPGDFESLARLLHPIDSSTVPGLGRRSMAVVPAEVPGGEGAEPFVLALRSALTTVDADPPVVAAGLGVLETGVQTIVNTAAVLAANGAVDPVGPPVYGQWLAERNTIDRTVPEPRDWLDGLNVGPAGRVAAAAGGDVVRADQEELMAKAWAQVRDVDRANAILRWLQLSLVASRKLASSRIETRSATSMAQLCRPAAARLPFSVGSSGTLAERIAASPLPVGALDTSYAKVAMRAARRAQLPVTVFNSSLRERMLVDSSVLVAPDVELVPRGFSDLGAVKDVLTESGGLVRMVAGSQTTVGDTFTAIQELPALLAAVNQPVPRKPPPGPPRRPPHQGGGQLIQDAPPDVQDRPPAQHLAPNRLQQNQPVRVQPAQNRIGPGQVAANPALQNEARQVQPMQVQAGQSQVVPVRAGRPPVGQGVAEIADLAGVSALSQVWLEQAAPRIEAVRQSIALPDVSTATVTEFASRFGANGASAFLKSDGNALLAQRIGVQRSSVAFDVAALPAATAGSLVQAVAVVRDRLITDADSPPVAQLQVLAAQSLQQSVVAGVAPERTFGMLAAARVQLDTAGVSRVVRRLLHPVMLAPRFTEPVSDRLKRVSVEHLLANAQRLEPNGITLLATNPPFVEALMVGINHEMARELLYRGYPTDRRGTYFRRFWHRLDGLDDIAAVTDWDSRPLGAHGVGGVGGNLVVVLRGDLLRRYPRTIVTARKGTVGRAVDNQATFVEDPAVQPRPALFSGQIEPDITYVGLQLTAAEAALDGWFVLLEQPPTEPRFGLDVESKDDPAVPAGWNDLSWHHATTVGGQLSASASGLTKPQFPEGLGWGVDASRTAAILLQQPFRLALPTAHYLHQGH